jgi:hypothetical protein
MDNLPVDQNTRYDDEREATILQLREQVAGYSLAWTNADAERASLQVVYDICRKQLADALLQNDVLRSMNKHMLEALEKIAVIRQSETTGAAMSKSEFWAKEAIGAVKTLENHAEKRIQETPFTREMFEKLKALPHPPELDKPCPEDENL